MLENIVSGLLLALISSMAFIAYRHRDAFEEICQKIMPPICIGFGVIAIGWFGFQIGYTVAEFRIKSALKLDYSEFDGLPSIPGIQISFWIFLSFWAFFIYMAVLSKLSSILNRPEEKKKGENQNTTEES